MTQLRSTESEEHRSERLAVQRNRSRQARQRAIATNRESTQLANRTRMQTRRALTLSSFCRIAFDYDPVIEYSAHSKIIIENMDQECNYCNALKFKNETAGMCCSSGKVILPPLSLPPEPFKSLMSGEGAESKLFLKHIRKCNCCFQMTSFGANIINNTDSRGCNFDSTFKIQGQVYHQIGSLMPMPAERPKFLQIYFMGDEEDQVNIPRVYNHIPVVQERAIVATLESFLAAHNQLL